MTLKVTYIRKVSFLGADRYKCANSVCHSRKGIQVKTVKIISPLFVENQDQTELLKKAFKKFGHEITFVVDTKEILDENKYHPDVILLEPSLFHWEWLEVLTGLKRDFPEIPVILYSTMATAEKGFCSISNDSKVFVANDVRILTDNLERILTTIVIPKKKVLLIDDDVNGLKSYRRMLRKNPWHIFLAQSGIEALGVLQKEDVDLVVTDIKMPEMHGVELISEIRKGSKTIPIIVISAYPGMEDDDELKFHGIAGFVEKPIDFEVLQNTISTLLQ